MEGEKWTQATIENVERGCAAVTVGRCGILESYPEVVDCITNQLRGIRTTGLQVNIHVARALMLAIINTHIPHIMAPHPRYGTIFTCSEYFVRDFLKVRMSWSLRQGTQAAKKIPENWEDTCEMTYYRIVHLMIRYKIPTSLLINMDQTGIILIPGADSTYHEKGAKQVHILGKTEKRAYTLAVASSCDGDILPFQAVWGGKTIASCPKPDVRREAESLGFHF